MGAVAVFSQNWEKENEDRIVWVSQQRGFPERGSPFFMRFFELGEGFEPTAYRLQSDCSTTELSQQYVYFTNKTKVNSRRGEFFTNKSRREGKS